MGGIISGIGSIIGGNQAASAAKAASDQQMRQYYITRQDLTPFRDTGAAALPNLLSLAQSGPNAGGTDYLSAANAIAPGQFTQAELEATPGYQFTRDQGLKSVQSAAAARGLGVSGASLKGAADYATGLADKTYLDQFNVAQQRFQNQINLNQAQQGNIGNQFQRLYNTANLGQTAATSTGQIGAQLAGNAGQFLTASGALQAAGTQGLASGLGNALNQGLGYYLGGGTAGYGGGGGGGSNYGWTGVGVGQPNPY